MLQTWYQGPNESYEQGLKEEAKQLEIQKLKDEINFNDAVGEKLFDNYAPLMMLLKRIWEADDMLEHVGQLRVLIEHAVLSAANEEWERRNEQRRLQDEAENHFNGR